MIIFRSAQLTDLDEIMTIEHSGFTDDEAATRTAMHNRILTYPETFIVANQDNQLLGYIVGPSFNHRYLTDQLYETATPNQPGDDYQAVLSLVVSPKAQGMGIGSQLLKKLAEIAKQQGRKAITLTCLKALIPFYQKNGYQNEGVAASSHANEIWYNMVLKL